MDISIPGPIELPSCSSQKPLKRPGKHVTNQENAKSSKRRKQVSRTISEVTVDNEEAYNTILSAKTKETILKLKKISDPFDEDLQSVVDDVFDHFDQNAGGEVDLAESALLLSSVTHVFSNQVKSLHEEVLTIANRLSGKETPLKGRQRKKNCETEKPDEKIEDNKKSQDEDAPKDSENGQSAAETIAKSGDLSEIDSSVGSHTGQANGSENTNPEEHANDAAGAGVSSTNPNSTVPLNSDSPTEGGLNGNETAGENESAGTEGQQEPSIEEVTKLESEILNEIPSRCTRRQSERLKNILNIEKIKERDYTLKKRKFDEDPPELISCLDEWNAILAYIQSKGDIDVDEVLPPVLEVQVGRKKKKVTINNNEVDDDMDCVACHTANGEVAEVVEISENEKMEAALRLSMASGLDGQQYETLDHLPDDVQERFHALIQEMHKLPFDYGLMQQDMFKAYQQKFLQAVSLLSQNSVLVKRSDTELTEKDVVAKVLVLNDSEMSESEQTISSIAELLNQVRQQATEEYHKGKQSKSDAEVPVSQMIATLKRIICSRYKKWHVRTDGDKAVFQRIKEFEDKVKSVLRKEAEQGLFDVKKYEMEVMDVTIKESHDGESEDLFCPLSPILPPEGAESPKPEDTKNWALSCSSRRSSVAGSVDGSNSWIRLYDIFSHMKKIDNSETCRHFYAVLALLSHKNLNINYDTLFSKESAKLITKLLKSHNESQITKYPVGAKIMTSRCPDVDRDEVLLTPVFNSETIQHILEQDGYLSSSGYQSDGQGSSSTTGNYSFSHTKTIQDAISEFVIDPGEPCPDDLFISNRRKKH